MATLKDLLAQKAALEEQIEAAQKQDRQEAIAKIRELMDEFGLTLADISNRAVVKTSAAKGGKVAAKYRNDATGETWSGRGLQPRWLKAALASGKTIEDFTV